MMFSYPVVFVDIETTGGSWRSSRVLEVAAIRYENGVETAQYTTLLNPESYIPSQITRLTGISDDMVVGAPVFNDIADQLYELFEGAVFIAHNVRFDYSFLKQEFATVGVDFSPKLLCTVRLSRALYSDQKGHSLAKLIERHDIPVDARHRALADAQAIQYFSKLAYDEHGEDIFNQMVERQLRTQYLPPNLDQNALNEIGNIPGVYIFKDDIGQPLYVGKSVTLKNRIMSHFRDTSARELKISQNVHHVETVPTGSELAALVLESKLVKELQPLFNRQLRRVSKYAMLFKQETDGYNTVAIKLGSIDDSTDLSNVYGMYETRTKAKRKLEELTKTFQLCPKLMGLENAKNACFSYSLGRCKGACIGEEQPDSYNRRFEIALEYTKVEQWPYGGPVTIPINTTGERVILNNWMIHGYIDQNGERIYDELEPNFDVDEYKIIRRFLRANRAFVSNH